MTEIEAKAAFDTYFMTTWPTLQPTIRFDLENVGTIEPNANLSWVRARLQGDGSNQETLGPLGARQYMRTSEVWCWCRVPAGTGTARMNAMIDALRTMFEGVSFGGIKPAGAVRTVTRGAGGQWYEVVVIAPVMYTETR